MTTSKEEIVWDSQGPTASNGGRPRTNAEAEARGLDGLGVPLGPTGLGEPTDGHGQNGSGGRKGGKSMLDKIRQMESGDIADQEGLHAFAEAGRTLCMNIALLTEMTSGQLKADAKAKARDSVDGRMTVAEKLRLSLSLRKIAGKLHRASDNCADAAAAFSASWREMEKFLDELDGGREAKPKAKGGFSITGLRGERR